MSFMCRKMFTRCYHGHFVTQYLQTRLISCQKKKAQTIRQYLTSEQTLTSRRPKKQNTLRIKGTCFSTFSHYSIQNKSLYRLRVALNTDSGFDMRCLWFFYLVQVFAKDAQGKVTWKDSPVWRDRSGSFAWSSVDIVAM